MPIIGTQPQFTAAPCPEVALQLVALGPCDSLSLCLKALLINPNGQLHVAQGQVVLVLHTVPTRLPHTDFSQRTCVMKQVK
eukprot:1952593-Amphidinium_carterae.1